MALGHLRRLPGCEPLSEILRQFGRADFPAAVQAAQTFWSSYRGLRVDGRIDPNDLEVAAVQHTVMCVGTICAFLRTGGDVPVERAVVKLEALALGFLHSRDPYSYLLARLTRSEEHTSELQSLMRISYAVFCLKKTTTTQLMR